MPGRPKIKLPYSQPEKVLQVLAPLTLLGTIVYVAVMWARLPAQIPSHFGAGGAPDTFGGKGSLLMLPIMSCAFYAVFTVLERFPWIYNYPREITEENAPKQYRLGRLLIEWMKLIVILISSYIELQTIRVAQGHATGLGGAFLPVSMVGLFGVMGFILYKMVKNK